MTIIEDARTRSPRRDVLRKGFVRLSAIAGALTVGLLCGAAGEAPSTVVSIDATRPGATIDRHIFGQFSEHLGAGVYGGIWVGKNSPIPNTRGIRNDVVGALRALHVPDVRWPGGCYAEEYHWQQGIGPANLRPVTLNTNWGGVSDSNAFGTDEYMDFIGQIGSEAYIVANVGSDTPQAMAQWLQYLTTTQPTTLERERAANGHPPPYTVPFFGIGNESYGCGGSMTAQHYADEYRQFATYAKNFNPAQAGMAAMKLVAVGPNGGNTGWTETMMQSNQQQTYGSFHMDGLSLHYYAAITGYPNPIKATGFNETGYATVLKSALAMEGFVAANEAVMDKYDPERKVAMVVDEWGAWYQEIPGTNPAFLRQQNTQRDALIAALNLHIFARHAARVRMANIAQTVNVLQAMVQTTGSKMVLTPTYYVFKMYVPFQDATLLPLQYDSGVYQAGGVTLPAVDAVAALGKDGRTYLALVNLDPRNQHSVRVAARAARAEGNMMSAPKMDSANDLANPDTVVPRAVSVRADGGGFTFVLPPESVGVVSW